MEGIVSVLKPPAMSSSDVVVDIRRIYGTKRVGHLGTLDPEAAGVLPVCVGRAVRLFDYLVDKQKEYLTEIVFGSSTDTQDAQGKILSRSKKIVSMEQLMETLPSFSGMIEQVAPAYSALKYQGKKMYDHVRSGHMIPEKRRLVNISDLTLLEELSPNHFMLRVTCSRGTYIRTLCSDIGEMLGVPAHMSFLLRTRSGSFTLDNSFSIDQLIDKRDFGKLQESLVSCEQALSFMPMLKIDIHRMKPALNGLETNIPKVAAEDVRLYAGEVFLGIGKVNNGSVRLAVNLFTESL